MSNYLLLNQKTKMMLNELDSNINVGYPVEILDILMNKGIVAWFQHYVESVENTQTIHDKLSSLVVRTPIAAIPAAPGYQSPLPPASTEIDTFNVYEFRFADLDYKYYRHLASHVMMKKNNCPAVRGRVRIEQHDDLETVLIDDNRKPSWRYREVVGVFHRDGKTYTDGTMNTVDRSLSIYTEDFEIETLHLTYLKEPNKVCFGGYLDLDGNPTVRSECDIPPIYYDEIVTFIADIAQRTYGFTNNNK